MSQVFEEIPTEFIYSSDSTGDNSYTEEEVQIRSKRSDFSLPRIIEIPESLEAFSFLILKNYSVYCDITLWRC